MLRSGLFVFSILLFTKYYAYAQPNNPRTPSEWEEVEAVMMEVNVLRAHPKITWQEAIDPYVKVAKVCKEEGIKLYLLEPDTIDGKPKGFDMDTVLSHRGLLTQKVIIFHTGKPVDNYPWARDHGPYTIYSDTVSELSLAGYSDDMAAPYLAKKLNVNYINLPSLVSSRAYYDGGNWLTDGHGYINFKNTNNTTVNPGLVNSPSEIKNYLGAGKTFNLKGVSVHTDYWLKLIDEETFIVADIPLSNYGNIDSYRKHNEDIHAAIDSIKTRLKTVFNRDYSFHYIQNAPTYDNVQLNTTYLTSDAGYTNSLIINSHVLVPQYDAEPYDSMAIAAYKKLMPGYKIVGVNCRQYAVGAGAIHCITRGIYSSDPIYIKHKWLKDTISQNSNGYEINAEVKAKKGVKAVTVRWAIDTTKVFKKLSMQSMGHGNYQVFIPQQKSETTIYYYIEAEDSKGKVITKPFVAPAYYYHFTVKPQLVALHEIVPEEINIYPNPVNDILHIKLKTQDKFYDVQLYNYLGQKVLTQPQVSKETSLNLSPLEDGIYYLLFEGQEGKHYGSKILKVGN